MQRKVRLLHRRLITLRTSESNINIDSVFCHLLSKIFGRLRGILTETWLIDSEIVQCPVFVELNSEPRRYPFFPLPPTCMYAKLFSDSQPLQCHIISFAVYDTLLDVLGNVCDDYKSTLWGFIQKTGHSATRSISATSFPNSPEIVKRLRRSRLSSGLLEETKEIYNTLFAATRSKQNGTSLLW